MKFSSSRTSATAALLCGLSATVQAFDRPIGVGAPALVPAGASGMVPHDFISISFPAHFFSDFAGNLTHPNLFSRDVLALLASKTGKHPFIRVGGTSTDRVWYNASQEAASYVYYGNDGSQTQALGIADWVYIGPAFFGGFLNFPGARWSWQVNMGKTYYQPDGLDNAIEVAQLVMDTVKDDLESFEIGNEPEIFVRFGHRNGTYTIADYVDDWNRYADAASERVLKGNPYGLEETRFFQGLTVAGVDEPEWNLESALEHGLDRQGHLKSVSFHQYAGSSQPWIRLGSYMNHTANAANVTQYAEQVEIATAYDPSLPLVLGETNSNAANLNMAQIEGVFGSALWTIDHIMMSMATNITRINLIQGVTFGYSAWVPIETPGREPYVRAPLYGQVFGAAALGTHPEVQVLEVPDLPWNMSAYGIYEAGTLVRYAVVNYDEWNATTAYPRPSQEVCLDVPYWVDEVAVRRLTGNGASADEGIEWAGQSWNYSDGRLVEHGAERWEVYRPTNLTVSFEIPSTEAVLVSLGRSQ